MVTTEYQMMAFDFLTALYNLDGKDTLRVCVRAIYKGEPNGPWNCCMYISHDGSGGLIGYWRTP